MTREITDRKKESSLDREDKPNRIEESRAMDLHSAHKRAVMNMEHHSPLNIDEAVIPKGMEYRWICESVLGQPNTQRVIEARQKGWTPVPADRHPDMCFQDFFGRNSHMNSYIYYSGLVLCERSAELGRIEREKYDKLNYQNVVSLAGTDNYMGEPTIPVRNNSSTYITKSVSGN